MPDVEVSRSPFGGWWWTCTQHGHSGYAWAQSLDATFDALGHAAAHHPLVASRS